MNDYTRRTEIYWTLAATIVLVICLGAALVRLVTARPALIPDPQAREAASAAAAQIEPSRSCDVAAERLVTEADVFRASAKAARLSAAPAEVDKKKPTRPSAKPKVEKAPDVALAWPAAAPSHKQARALLRCKQAMEVALGVRSDDAAAWATVEAIAAVPEPPASDNEAQIAAAQRLYTLVEKATLAPLAVSAEEARVAAVARAADTARTAAEAKVHGPLPPVILPRPLAILLGVALGLLALGLSVVSVRVASVRRLEALAPLRDPGKPRDRGMHAATLIKLAGQHDGGEPGAIIGAGVLGLVAALSSPLNTDVFVGSVMGGFALGFGIQRLVRILAGQSQWRRRALELSEIEKPAIPIALIVRGVNQGLEAQFLAFFSGLPLQEQALTVEKLAIQAEEQILAQAEAGALASQGGGAP